MEDICWIQLLSWKCNQKLICKSIHLILRVEPLNAILRTYTFIPIVIWSMIQKKLCDSSVELYFLRHEWIRVEMQAREVWSVMKRYALSIKYYLGPRAYVWEKLRALLCYPVKGRCLPKASLWARQHILKLLKQSNKVWENVRSKLNLIDNKKSMFPRCIMKNYYI